MKKLFSFLLVITLISVTNFNFQSAKAAPLNEIGDLTLMDLGMDADMVLRGPYDSQAIRFDFPASWALQPGAELELEVTSFYVGTGSETENNLIGAILNVSFNGRLQQSIPLKSGDRVVYKVPISAEDLMSPFEGGWHEISFFLDAAVDCNIDFHDTTVIIDARSKVNFPHEEIPLILDLKRLPWPIFLERGKIIEPVLVVIPNSPSAYELQAGLVVMGTFGRLTNGNLPLSLVYESLLTEEMLNNSHLIVVGKPLSFSRFTDLKFPIPLAGGKFTSTQLNPDDGLIQILASPWNPNRVVLMVSGNSDQSVVKSSQALSSSYLQTGDSQVYSIISQVYPLPSEGIDYSNSLLPSNEDISFSNLGYSFATATGIGTHWLGYEFMIPAGQLPSEGVYIDLNYSTSDLVDPLKSEGVVYLNDVQIGSVLLSDESSNLVTNRINFPLSAIRPGLNLIDIVFNLLPRDHCSFFSFSGLWVTLYPDSAIHLPLSTAIYESAEFTLKDLKSYPDPFANDPSLSTTSFILSEKDPYSWQLAGEIAYDLGTHVTSAVLGFRASFDTTIPEDVKTNNIILIGEPRNFSLISELSESMPAYFEDGTNIAVLPSQQIIFHISEDKSLGYLQLFPSPWNDQSAILGIFGTNPEGLASAATYLLNNDLRGLLAGNFATLDGSHAMVVDTRTGLGIGRIDSSLGSVVTQEEVSTQPQTTPEVAISYESTRELLLIGILTVSAAFIGILLLAIIRRKRSS